jgi:hypothetical protein
MKVLCGSTGPRTGRGGDRDTTRAAHRLPARNRPRGLSHQPDGRGPLPGPALGRRAQGRPRRRGRALECAAPTRTRTGRCRPTPSSPRPSRCWPARSRTPSGRAPPCITSCAPTCASTIPASSPRSPTSGAESCGLRPAPSWPPLPPRPPRRHSPSPRTATRPRRSQVMVDSPVPPDA